VLFVRVESESSHKICRVTSSHWFEARVKWISTFSLGFSFLTQSGERWTAKQRPTIERQNGTQHWYAILSLPLSPASLVPSNRHKYLVKAFLYFILLLLFTLNQFHNPSQTLLQKMSPCFLHVTKTTRDEHGPESKSYRCLAFLWMWIGFSFYNLCLTGFGLNLDLIILFQTTFS